MAQQTIGSIPSRNNSGSTTFTATSSGTLTSVEVMEYSNNSSSSVKYYIDFNGYRAPSSGSYQKTKSSSGISLGIFSTSTNLSSGQSFTVTVTNTSENATLDNVIVYFSFTGTGGGGSQATTYFSCSDPSYFTCNSSVNPGEDINISWGTVSVWSGTLSGYRITESYKGTTTYVTSKTIPFHTGSAHAGRTITFSIQIVGTDSDGASRILPSQLTCSCTVNNITPVHIKQAGSITSVSRTSGEIFGDLNGYYLNASNTSNVVLNWSAASGNNPYATPQYIIQKNNVDIITVGTNRSYSIPITHMPGAGETATFRIKCYSTANTSPTMSGYFFTTPITVYGIGINSTTLNVLASNTFTTTNTISCNIPAITIASGASISNITRQYTVQYKLKTATTYTTFTPTSNTTVQNTQNFVFDPSSISGLTLNSQFDYKVTCTLLYNGSSMDISASGTTLTSSIWGQPPNQLLSLTFSLDTNSYFGTFSPHTYTVSNSTWSINNTFKFGAASKINIRINLGAVINASTYKRVAEFTWKRGNDSLGTITCISEGADYIDLVLSATTGSTATTINYVDTPITLKIPGLFDTSTTAATTFLIIAKSQLISDPTVFLSANQYALNDNTHFGITQKPVMYTNGTTIPQLNYNGTLSVNFSTGDEPVTDYSYTDIRARSLNGVELYGYKVYVKFNNVTTLLTESILTQDDTGATFDSTNNIFKPTSFVPMGNQSGVGNTVSLNLDILSDPTYLKTLLNGGNSLTSLDDIKSIKYKITVVDILRQESTDDYGFTAVYDFRIPSEMLESPKIEFNRYLNNTYTPLIRNIKYYGDVEVQNALCFHGQSSNETNAQKDYIIFEWYPALKASDQATNPTHYALIDGKYYLLDGYTDPNSYYIYKWNYGNTDINTNTYRRAKMVLNTDYYAITEATASGNIVKYVGRYGVNLRNLQEDELSYMCIIPAYTSSGNDEEKISHGVYSRTNLYNNHICYNSGTTAVPIYIARFTTPNTLITGIDRTTENDKKISFKVNDYGTSKKLNGININESNYMLYGPLSRLKLDAVLYYQGEPVNYDTNVYTQTKDSNTTSTILNHYQYTDDFDLDIYGAALLDKNAYVAKITTYIECIRCNLIVEGTAFKLESTIQQLSNITEQYIAPAFGTLSLRKNKIGINKSALTRVEETLSIVGKDRCDKITDIANPNSFASSYKNIVGIYASDFSKMPQYNNDSIDLPISQNNLRGSYIGFYGATQENEPWLGSIGFEEDGNGYIVTSEIINGERIYKKTKIGDSYIIGSGLVVTDGILKHSNIVEPKMQQTVYPITFDSEGHITSAGEPFSVPSGYILDFDATDWTNLTIAIPESIHNCGADPCVDVYYLEEGFYKKAWGIYTSIDWNIVINTDGDISLKTLTPFAGKIVIK